MRARIREPKDPVLCQWSDCQADSLLGIEFCREHARCGRDLIDRAMDAALEYGDSQPDPKAYWAEVDGHPTWRRYWWEPRPRRAYRHISLYVRREVAKRYGAAFGTVHPVQCDCGAPGEIVWLDQVPRFSGLHLDHVRPVSRGGRNTASNIQLLCPRCNLSKGARVEG